MTLAAIVFAPNPVELVSEEEPSTERAAEDEEKNAEKTSERESEQEASGDNEASERQRNEQANAESENAGKGNEGDGQSSAGRSDEEASPPSSDRMSLTVPRLGVYGDTVRNSADPAVLHQGAQKLPSTGFPWQDGANVYLAGHRLGYPGTDSFLAFYDQRSLEPGDEIYVEDSEGTEYTYRVFDSYIVSPTEVDVTQPVEGKNILTLQSCTLPDYSERLITRAELVEVS